MAEHTLVFPVASVQAADEVPPGTPVLVQAKLLWGGDVLGIAHVRPREALRIEDFGLDVPGGDGIVVARGETLVLPSGEALPRGARMAIRLGRTMLRVELVADDVAALPKPTADRRVALGLLGAAAVHLMVMGALYRGRAGEGTIEEAQRASLERYMAASEARAEADLAASIALAGPSTMTPGLGSRDADEGDRGKAGNPVQAATDRRRAVARGTEAHADKPDASEIASFGLLELLAADGQRAGTSAFAADMGRSAMGNIFGTTIGDAEGFAAVDLSGTGSGAGGKGAGVAMKGIGHDLGLGGLGRAGGRAMLSGTHVVKEAVCRCGSTQVNGRLPPEAVQRVVRASMGRYRACYEAGLFRDPSLEGTVTVKFVIGRSGAVEMASATGDVKDASVTSCIGKAFERLSFPEPTGGIVTVVYPLTLSPN